MTAAEGLLLALAVGVATGVGAMGRYGAEVLHARWRVRHGHVRDRQFPWATATVNVVGSALFGVAGGLVLGGAAADPTVLVLVGSGVAGGLTTYSTFALDVVELLREGRRRVAAAYVLSSVGLGVAAALVAYRAVGGP
jgi:fluoride exporter